MLVKKVRPVRVAPFFMVVCISVFESGLLKRLTGRSCVGASLLAKVVNDDVGILIQRGALRLFASKLAPTQEWPVTCCKSGTISSGYRSNEYVLKPNKPKTKKRRPKSPKMPCVLMYPEKT